MTVFSDTPIQEKLEMLLSLFLSAMSFSLLMPSLQTRMELWNYWPSDTISLNHGLEPTFLQ